MSTTFQRRDCCSQKEGFLSFSAVSGDFFKPWTFQYCSVEGKDLQHGKHGVLRDLRDHSKVQCHNCVTNWPKSIVYCTCGTCLRLSDKIRKSNEDCYDVLSIPNYVIKKGPSHGALHGNTKANNSSHSSHLIEKGRENTNQHRMERRTLRTLRCDCGRRSLLYRCSVRALQT